jgi:L-alanine-DL-glutamate epimerase-like enolase superfamily enzyme
MTADLTFPPLALDVQIESFAVAGAFTIARGSRTHAVVVTVTVSDGHVRGRGECVPYARYGESVEGVAHSIRAQAGWLNEGGAHLAAITGRMPAGAARNGLDSALWDYAAKRAGVRAWDLAGEAAPVPTVTCYTLSLGTAAEMEEAARRAATRPLLKVKLGGDGDDERIRAVRRGAPEARLMVDANESWSQAVYQRNLEACLEAGVELVEQPLPAGNDQALRRHASPLPVCADESVHTVDGLDAIAERYSAINIKLDKTGGLSGALHLAREAERRGLAIMVGCMLGTSLAMAPATLLMRRARHVDLDGPLLLAQDRTTPLSFEGNRVHAPDRELWG